MSQSPTEIPTVRMRDGNRRVLLARRPRGIPQADDFGFREDPRPTAPDGGILVRNVYLSVDPAQRGWASAEGNYSDPVAIGGTMRALAVGVVVDTRSPEVAEGEWLYGWFGWQDWCATDPAAVVMRVRDAIPLAASANLLGINGLTAYLALTELGRPRTGDTLLVSTAAGAVGGFVGQIGRLLGCRTVGLTGDDDKVGRCRARYGYDAAFNYKTADLGAALGAAAGPKGYDIYFDNTGGAILDTALRHMAPQGRVIQCGTAATSAWHPVPTGPRNEREVLTRRLVWSGFVVFDHAARFAEAATALAAWYRDGRLVSDEDVEEGIERAAGALEAVYAGRNRGKKLIYVG